MPPAKRKSIASSESSGGGSGVVIVCGMISSSTAGTPTPRSQSQPRSRRGKTSRTVTKRSKKKKNRWISRRIRVWPLAAISTRSSQNISNDVMKPRAQFLSDDEASALVDARMILNVVVKNPRSRNPINLMKS